MGQVFELTISQSGIATLGHEIPGDPVEQLTARVMRELEFYLRSLTGTTSIRALVLRRVQLPPRSEALCPPSSLQDRPWSQAELSVRGHGILNLLAELPFPTVAVLDGVCLGPELELALACRYRMATADPDTRIGFPDVEYGLIPALGGTQRLPRLVGFEHALQMIVDGSRLDGQTAWDWGLADFCCSRTELEDHLISFLQAVQTASGRAAVRKHRQRPLLTRITHDNWLTRKWVVDRYRHRLRTAATDLGPAPLRALDLIQRTVSERLSHGLEEEAQEFALLAQTQTTKHLLRLHHVEQYLRAGGGVSGYRVRRQVESVGVLGDGPVGELVGKLAMAAGVPTRIHAVADLPEPEDCRQFADADLVFETAVEDPAIKRQFLQLLEPSVRSDCLLVTTTAFLPLASLAQPLHYPERLVGMHFLPDAARGPLVEIVRGPQTQTGSVIQAIRLAQRLGYTPLVVADGAGFLVTRLQTALFSETMHLLAEGAGPEQIDRTMRDFGMRLGPCRLLDRTGLGEVWYAGKILQARLSDRFRWNELLDYLCNEHGLGCGENAGIFSARRHRLVVNPRFTRLANEYRAYIGRSPRPFSATMIRERLIGVLVNEAFRCLDEGIVYNHEHLDYAAVCALGFPAALGGPLTYAETVGLEVICRQLTELELQYTTRFQPSRLLTQMVNSAAIYIRREEERSMFAGPTPIMHPDPLPQAPRVPVKERLRIAM